MIWESSDNKWYFSLPETDNSTVKSSGIIIGLAFKLCGAIGVNTKALLWGYIIGPPQLKEYPVEPVGDDIISPSAQ